MQVDNNVTRHLDKELQQNDWDVFITHYLGLDHVGHIEGPNSENMKKKLNEMDEVFISIYNKISKSVSF